MSSSDRSRRKSVLALLHLVPIPNSFPHVLIHAYREYASLKSWPLSLRNAKIPLGLKWSDS